MYLDVMAELYSDLSRHQTTIFSFGLTRQEMIVLAKELNEIQSTFLFTTNNTEWVKSPVIRPKKINIQLIFKKFPIFQKQNQFF
jgi:hypothetical protein